MDDHVAASDCERLVQVWADVVWQPVNTVSSLAMGGFGLYLLLGSRAWVDPARRRTLTLVGAALLSAGIGSVLYHGPGGLFARVAHDVTIAAIPLAAAIGMLAERRPMRAMQWFGAVLAVAVVFQMLGPAHLLAAVLASIVVVRLGIDRFRSGLVRVGPLAAAGAVFAVALPVYSLSRTDGPLCRPDSLWQGHALWHLLVGAGVVALAAGLGLLPPGGEGGAGDENRSMGTNPLR